MRTAIRIALGSKNAVQVFTFRVCSHEALIIFQWDFEVEVDIAALAEFDPQLAR